ncbi:hypothetical protein LIER_36175 [Lithospermum erythrorhizon]|uniref:Retrovirus-related Pol polyprotein from transposon TNT 1-94-like beta-barrel domain-containing protein n=1 Tax=Lithospermum erythrorhizon TaxID=34254 RepID=A0AAV3P3V0_LITER
MQYPNYIKKQTRIYYTTHSDEEEGSDGSNNFVAFTAQIHEEGIVPPTVNHTQPDSISDDEEKLTEEGLIANYQMLFYKWSKLTQTYTTVEVELKHLVRENMELTKVVEDQKMEIGILEGKIQSMTRGIKMMNSSTEILDEILEKRQKEHIKLRKGHIAPYCYKVYGKGRSKYYLPEKQWVRKEPTVSNVVFTSLKATAWEGWYFDSGCSRHMTGNQSYLTKIVKLKRDCVTFGGGSKEKITGKYSLSMDGLPELENILLVDSFTVNLISISQLYDEGMKVAFTEDTCDVSNSCDRVIMKGTRSPDNCYLWTRHRAMSCRT